MPFVTASDFFVSFSCIFTWTGMKSGPQNVTPQEDFLVNTAHSRLSPQALPAVGRLALQGAADGRLPPLQPTGGQSGRQGQSGSAASASWECGHRLHSVSVCPTGQPTPHTRLLKLGQKNFSAEKQGERH